MGIEAAHKRFRRPTFYKPRMSMPTLACDNALCLLAVSVTVMKRKKGPTPGSRTAKRGGYAVRDKYGPEFFSEIGKKGGEATKRNQGSEYYARIGRTGGLKRLGDG